LSSFRVQAFAMEGSASAPQLSSKVLNDEDYRVPGSADCRGIGDTGLPKRILAGPMSKDKGVYSSRINQIVRQAGKVPGPGKYMAHEPWDEGRTEHVIHAGNKFPAGTRDYKPMNKTPAPATYERKDFHLGVAIASSEHLSCNPRIIHGKIPKGKRRSFLEQAINHGSKIPAPGHNDLTQKRNNKADTSIIGVPNWSKELTKTKGRGKVEIEIGPNHYTLPHDDRTMERSVRDVTIPKARAQNFLDKAVKEKYVDIRNKISVPGPGHYNAHDYDDSKFSRGTKYLQLRGMSRSSVSGYF